MVTGLRVNGPQVLWAPQGLGDVLCRSGVLVGAVHWSATRWAASKRMAKTRSAIPRRVRDTVLKEFAYRCAVCGAEQPHLHHIDEQPDNNDPLNLIPLCPNCHLTDQHDAANAAPQARLRFFRRYKHRLILRPQFKPLFRRMQAVLTVAESDGVFLLGPRVSEFVDLVRNMTMGAFYANELLRILKPIPDPTQVVIGDEESEARHRDRQTRRDKRYRERVREATPLVEELIIEMLDFQLW